VSTTHEPEPGTFYGGGTYAKCRHCGATILWAAVGSGNDAADYTATEWRTDGSASGTECDAAPAAPEPEPEPEPEAYPLTADEWERLAELTMRAWKQSTSQTSDWYLWGAVFGLASDGHREARWPAVQVPA
jgi:hypothetical protein